VCGGSEGRRSGLTLHVLRGGILEGLHVVRGQKTLQPPLELFLVGVTHHEGLILLFLPFFALALVLLVMLGENEVLPDGSRAVLRPG